MSAAKSDQTVQKLSAAATPKSSLLKDLVLDYQQERLSEKQAEAMKLPCTSKATPVLGIPTPVYNPSGLDPRSIVWTHANFDPETKNILEAFAKSQDMRLCDILARVTMTWVQTNLAQITEEADGFIAKAHSIEDLVKQQSAAEAKLERTRALIAKMLADKAKEDTPSE